MVKPPACHGAFPPLLVTRTWWLMTAYFLVGAWISWRDAKGQAPSAALQAHSPRLAFWMVATFHILCTVRA